MCEIYTLMFGYNVILHYFAFDIKKETEVSTLIAVFYRLKKSSSEYFNWNIIRLPCTSRSSKHVELLVTFVRRNIQQCFYRAFTYKQALIAILKIWYSTVQKVTWGYHAYFKQKKCIVLQFSYWIIQFTSIILHLIT